MLFALKTKSKWNKIEKERKRERQIETLNRIELIIIIINDNFI